jgi:hypothetical protein
MICKRGCPPTNHIASYVLYGRKNKDEIIIVIDTVDNPIENGCCPYISGQPTLSIYISAEYQKLVLLASSALQSPIPMSQCSTHQYCVLDQVLQVTRSRCCGGTLPLVPLAVCSGVMAYDAVV